MKLILFAVAVGITSSIASAQPFHATHVTVTVQDPNGRPLPGANVQFCPPMGPGYSFSAESSGQVAATIPTAQYGIVAQFPGFATTYFAVHPFQPDGSEDFLLQVVPATADASASKRTDAWGHGRPMIRSDESSTEYVFEDFLLRTLPIQR